MPTHSIPVLLWRDAGGGVTGTLVGDYASTTARGASEAEALRQLRDFLEWRAKHQTWALEPDLKEPTLTHVKVEARGEYKLKKRSAPTPETVSMLIPCVTGRSPSGQPVCEAPHLAISFLYSEEQDLAELVRHYVKEELRGHSPADLALRLPPRGAWLDSLSIRERSSSRRPPARERPEIRLLMTVTDPLLEDWAKGSAAYQRETLVDQVAAKLRHEKANILLVGEAGIGKSTILLNAARKISRAKTGDVEDDEMAGDRAWRFWRGGGSRMIAGMRFLGEWQARCEEFVETLNGLNGVFCAENLLELLRVGGEDAGESVGAFLLPYLQRGDLRMVSEVTPAELDACRRLMPSLVDCFQIVHIEPFSEAEAKSALDRVAQACETSARIEFDPDVTRETLRWFQRFQPYAAMPGPAAAFTRKLAEQCRRKSPVEPGGKRRVQVEDAVALFVRRTGLPERLVRDDLPLPAEEIRLAFRQTVIGQEEAVEAATRTIAKLKAGLNDPARPVGVMLFCGPTGVGKTALAKAMADFCFGAGAEKDRLTRLDMSEYSGPGAAWRLLHGANNDAAGWINKVRRQPFSVVLFDEIEKAAPEVFDVLLGLLDEGRLTDRFGGVTQFRGAIVLLTSNLGATASGPMGFGASEVDEGHAGAVAKFFRPEFFNRLDAVVTFRPLDAEHVRQIAEKELKDLAEREGLAADGLALEWTEAVVDALVKEGHDRRLGARPLQRALERLVTHPLARWKLAHPAVRDRKLRVDARDGATIIEALPR